MTPQLQASGWTDLVAWVIWIHDLYELSREERLPRCWPKHPGLVEELRSLKAWREHIYDTPAAVAAPHTARSWHGELRQTIAAATSFWAPGCRVGHQSATPLADPDDKTRKQWIAAGPPVMDSAPEPDFADRPATMTAKAMHTALTGGTAQRHSTALPTAVRHDERWWRRNPDGTWTAVTDPGEAAALERSRRQLAAAEDAVRQHTNREDHQ